MQNWISLEGFCSIYPYTISSVEMQKSTNTVLPKSAFKSKKESMEIGSVFVQIDKTAVDKYENRRMDYWNMSHDLYYEIREILGSDLAIGRWLNRLDSKTSPQAWANFMDCSLFTPIVEERFSVVLTNNRYLFIRYVRWLLAIRKRYIKTRGYLK